MTYLTMDDIYMVVQKPILNQLLKDTTDISFNNRLSLAERYGIDLVSRKLVSQYDLDFEFRNKIQTVQKPANQFYTPGERFYLNTGTVGNNEVFTALFPALFFDSQTQYDIGDQVFYNGSLYTCILASSGISEQQNLQRRERYNKDINPLSPDKDAIHFQFVEKTQYPSGLPGSVIDIRNNEFFDTEFNFQREGNIGIRNETIKSCVATYALLKLYTLINYDITPDTVFHNLKINDKIFSDISEGKGFMYRLKLRQNKIDFINYNYIAPPTTDLRV